MLTKAAALDLLNRLKLAAQKADQASRARDQVVAFLQECPSTPGADQAALLRTWDLEWMERENALRNVEYELLTCLTAEPPAEVLSAGPGPDSPPLPPASAAEQPTQPVKMLRAVADEAEQRVMLTAKGEEALLLSTRLRNAILGHMRANPTPQSVAAVATAVLPRCRFANLVAVRVAMSTLRTEGVLTGLERGVYILTEQSRVGA